MIESRNKHEVDPRDTRRMGEEGWMDQEFNPDTGQVGEGVLSGREDNDQPDQQAPPSKGLAGRLHEARVLGDLDFPTPPDLKPPREEAPQAEPENPLLAEYQIPSPRYDTTVGGGHESIGLTPHEEAQFKDITQGPTEPSFLRRALNRVRRGRDKSSPS